MHLWIVVMIILLGAAVMTMDRYDVWVRILIWFLIGWFVLGALLLGYRTSTCDPLGCGTAH